ncbi:MAG: RluA family pseudouridine synthase [Proteobacteria bacterium]|nr:RluA family pseudouridine synthase [Pseudomonadota bacterium]MBU2227979.1 RluA family pseudouridine synthase [Pseudomonadota bacterium]
MGEVKTSVGGRQAHFTVAPEEEGTRLDLFLTGKETGLSRARIQHAVSEGRVTVNGRPARAGRRVKAGDDVVICIPALKSSGVLPEEIPLKVLYEDPFILVVDKPAGMVVHPAAGHPGGTLVNALLHHCRDLSGIGGVLRPGIVHRLDKETSGLLVVAKSDEAHRGLAGQFKRHEVAKTYQAIVYGNPKTGEGRIEAPVGRHPTDRKRMSTRSSRGKGAVTIWRVRERFGVASLLDVDIETGRTHQIRVHLMELGYPVVGDKVYGGAGRIRTIDDSAVRARIKALQRQALHAWRLSFAHPVTGEALQFTSPLPEDMAGLCSFLRERVKGEG